MSQSDRPDFFIGHNRTDAKKSSEFEFTQPVSFHSLCKILGVSQSAMYREVIEYNKLSEVVFNESGKIAPEQANLMRVLLKEAREDGRIQKKNEKPLV